METDLLRPSTLQEEPEPEKKGQRFWPVVIACFFVVIFVASASGAAWLWSYATTPGPKTTKTHAQVYIPPKTGFNQIKKELVEVGVLVDDIRFILLAKYMGVAHRLKAGEYVFLARQTPYDILLDLEEGKTVSRSFTIAEGLNTFQIAEVLGEQEWGKAQDILTLLQDEDFIQKELGLQVESLEGYLFPDTYFFQKGESLRSVVRRMSDRLRQVLAEECNQVESNSLLDIKCSFSEEKVDAVSGENIKKKRVSLDVHQLLTLASIIEKETGLAGERSKVAQVFLHRLRKGMKLQADPTVVYGLRKFGRPLSRKDLRTHNPYNTYVNKGLPPGPICNPGRASIGAVVKPGQDNYLYFVAQEDGSHYFSNNLREHNRAVARYRKKKH